MQVPNVMPQNVSEKYHRCSDDSAYHVRPIPRSSIVQPQARKGYRERLMPNTAPYYVSSPECNHQQISCVTNSTAYSRKTLPDRSFRRPERCRSECHVQFSASRSRRLPHAAKAQSERQTAFRIAEIAQHHIWRPGSPRAGGLVRRSSIQAALMHA